MSSLTVVHFLPPAGIETAATTMVFTLNPGIAARLGDDAAAGVGMASAVTLMLFPLLAASGSGGMIVAARHFGAGNREASARTVGVVPVLDFPLNLPVCLAMSPFTEPAPRFLGLGGQAVEMGNEYLQPMLIQVPIMAVGRGASEMMRSVGRTTTPFVVNSTAGVLNVLLTGILVRLGTDSGDGRGGRGGVDVDRANPGHRDAARHSAGRTHAPSSPISIRPFLPP